MAEESCETYIEPGEIDDQGRNFERINNRFIQKIAEIRRLQESLSLNIENLRALAIKEFEKGNIVNINSVIFSKRNLDVEDFAKSIGLDFFNSIVVSKKGESDEGI